MSTDPHNLPWRVGRKVRRTIYAVPWDDPDADGTLIGMMDSWDLAVAAVEGHNAALRAREASRDR